MPRLRYYVDSMGAVDTTAVLDAGQETANQLGLLRGILKYLQGGGLTPATRTLGLTGIPMSGQMLSFGDGSNSLSFEYVETLDGYGGMNIPILLGATTAETQTNTATAFSGFVGPKPNVTVTPDESSLIISSTVLGSAGNVTLSPPATVGVDGGLVPGTDVSAVPTQLWGETNLVHTHPGITTTSTLALAANSSREYLLLVNDSDSVIYINVGQAAVVNRGVRIGANGGSWEMSAALGNLDKRAIYAIHGGTGNKTLLVTEG